MAGRVTGENEGAKRPASSNSKKKGSVCIPDQSGAQMLEAWKGLCSTLPIPAFILTESGHVLAASVRAEAFVGSPRSRIIGASFAEFFSVEKGALCTRALNGAAARNCPVDYADIIRRQDKTSITVDIRTNPFLANGQKLFFVTLSDRTERDGLEQELQACEERYEALFEHLNRAIAVYEAINNGENFIIKNLNGTAETLERVRRQDVIGKTVTEVFPGAKELGVFSALQRVWRSGQAEHIPPAIYEDSRAGRSWRKNDIFKLKSGELVAVYVDTTDRMETLRKLEVSDTRYRALFENMRSGVVVYEAVGEGKDFVIKEFNRAAERNDKMKRKDVIGKTLTEVFPGAERIGFLDVLNRVWRSGNPEYFPPTLYEDTRIGIVWWEDYVYKLPSGEVVATFENVTERMNAVEELRKSVAEVLAERDKIDTIVQSIADAVFVVDPEGKIILFNDAAETMSGVSSEEAKGKAYGEVLRFVEGEDDHRGDAFIQAAQKAGVPASSDGATLVNREGKRISVSVSAAPLKSSEHGVSGVVVVFRDVTKEREADRIKTEFVSIASRQLHTPLTGIKWYLDLILREKAGELPPKAKSYVEQINAANERMIRLVEELLTISKGEEASKLEEEREPTDVTRIINDVINENVDLARANHVSVELSEDIPDKFLLRVNPKRMREIFRHLVSNAMKYSKPRGIVEITYDGDRKDALLFSVKDNGYGIPSRQQHRIFERFFRADNILTKYPEGTGLGLSAAKAAVEELGGRIWFSSIENVGSTFYFTLPKACLPGKRVRGPTERSASFAARTVPRTDDRNEEAEGWRG